MLKEISPEYSLEGLMVKFQYFGHLMQITDSLEKTLMLGKIEVSRRSGWQRMRWLDGITNLMDMSLSKLWPLVMDREVWHAQKESDMTNWTEKLIVSPMICHTISNTNHEYIDVEVSRYCYIALFQHLPIPYYPIFCSFIMSWCLIPNSF